MEHSEFWIERLRNKVPISGGEADIWRLFDDIGDLAEIAQALIEPFRAEATKIAGIETRGLIVATAVALHLGVGLAPIRKREGHFPGATRAVITSRDYRGVHHTLRIQRRSLEPGDRVVLIDDWIETGSQARAARTLIDSCGAHFLGVAAIVNGMGDHLAAEIGTVHSLIPQERLRWADR